MPVSSSDPATFVALVLLLCVLLLIVRQTALSRRHRGYARRMARATGHPSVGPAELRPVRIMGADGEYVACLAPFGVELRYETNAGEQFLGRYPSDDAAIAAIAAHEADQLAR
jgi:hypothetical protein